MFVFFSLVVAHVQAGCVKYKFKTFFIPCELTLDRRRYDFLPWSLNIIAGKRATVKSPIYHFDMFSPFNCEIFFSELLNFRSKLWVETLILILPVWFQSTNRRTSHSTNKTTIQPTKKQTNKPTKQPTNKSTRFVPILFSFVFLRATLFCHQIEYDT